MAKTLPTRNTDRAVHIETKNSSDRNNLIHLIEKHIGDSKPSVRLSWVKRIGEIPEELDAQDTEKIRFITIGLEDPIQAITLEAVSQISFLIHDKSKLALLLKIIKVYPALLITAQINIVTASLPEELKDIFENTVVASQQAQSLSINNNNNDISEIKSSPKTNVAMEPDKNNSQNIISLKDSFGATNIVVYENEVLKTPTQLPKNSSNIIRYPETPNSVIKTENSSYNDKSLTTEETEEAAIIIAELSLSDETIKELSNNLTPVKALIRDLSPKETPHKIDNYFLRHTAVLHIKDLHAEDMRYELYLAVLTHDPKDIVRQVVVEEARNLQKEHIQSIASLGLKDSAWQVRCGVLDYLLPLIADTEEQRKILTGCAKDTEYHVRQKVAEKLNALSFQARLQR